MVSAVILSSAWMMAEPCRARFSVGAGGSTTSAAFDALSPDGFLSSSSTGGAGSGVGPAPGGTTAGVSPGAGGGTSAGTGSCGGSWLAGSVCGGVEGGVGWAWAATVASAQPAPVIIRAFRRRSNFIAPGFRYWLPLLWLPGLVVAGGGSAFPAVGQRALRTPSIRRSGQVGEMVLFPGLARQRRTGGRLVEGVAQPAVPLRRHLGGLGIAVVGHPAAPAAVVGIPGVLVFVVAVAEINKPDEHTALGDCEQGAERGAVPPAEDLREHCSDRSCGAKKGEAALVKTRGP